MIKKIPQDNEIKRGDIVFYNGIFEYVNYPMIILNKKSDSNIGVRYYDPISNYHLITTLRIGDFIGA